MASRKRQTRGGARYNVLVCSSEQYNCIVENKYKILLYETYKLKLCLKCTSTSQIYK